MITQIVFIFSSTNWCFWKNSGSIFPYMLSTCTVCQCFWSHTYCDYSPLHQALDSNYDAGVCVCTHMEYQNVISAIMCNSNNHCVNLSSLALFSLCYCYHNTCAICMRLIILNHFVSSRHLYECWKVQQRPLVSNNFHIGFPYLFICPPWVSCGRETIVPFYRITEMWLFKSYLQFKGSSDTFA